MFYLKMSDNTKIAVYDCNPQARETILLIHGWPLSEKIFEYQKEPLLDRGYRVVTLDLRGFGNSDTPAGGYCYDRMATDIYEVIRHLGLHSFIMAGFSMGGAIALRYMRLFNGYGVNKLMLWAAAAPRWIKAPDFPGGLEPEAVESLITLAQTDRAQLARNFSHNQLFASPQSSAIKDWFEDIALSASGYATVKTALALRDEDGRGDLKYVMVPTAIFQGERDDVVPRELTMYQYRNIRGAVLYSFAHSGHGIFYDELAKFNAAMLQFLADY